MDALTPRRIGPWLVDPAANTIRPADDAEAPATRLEPKVMQLLLCLARHEGRPVTRASLLDEVWRGYFVGEDALNAAVARLRRALDRPGEPGSIETVPKVGYRLRLRVAPVATDPPARLASRRLAFHGVWVSLLAVGLIAATWSPPRTSRQSGAGGQPRMVPVTSFRGLEVEPDVSPGAGDRIAFAWRGHDETNWDIYVQGRSGGNPIRITTDPGSDHHPSWAPDGSVIAFARFIRGACELGVVDPDASRERVLGACPGHDVNDLSWAPDGRSLLVAARDAEDELFRILRVDVDTGAASVMTSPPAGSIGDLSAAFSPDGRTIAVVRAAVMGAHDLYLMPDGGGDLTRLTHDDLKIHGFDWNPEGDSLVYSSNRGGVFALWEVDRAGGPPRWLTGGGDHMDAPSVGGSSGVLAFERWQTDVNLYRVPLDATDRTPLPVLRSTRWHWHVALSADGGRVAVVSDRSGSPEIWITSADGRDPARRTSFGGPYLQWPAWSPDGRRLAFVAQVGGNADVYILSEGEAEPRRLTTDPAEVRAPRWSVDGQALFAASNANGRWEIVRLDLPGAGGPPAKPVFLGPGISAMPSADGRALFVVKPASRGIWRRDMPSGSERLVVDDLDPMDQDNWTLTRDAIYYVARPLNAPARLRKVDLTTGRSTDITPLPNLLQNSGLAVSPDERFLIFARIDRLDSDIVAIDR